MNIVFLALITATHAGTDACRESLQLRFTLPDDGATDVPLDARMVAAFIGWGDAGEWELALEVDGVTVEGSHSSWCYEHEGPHELHCWLTLAPHAPMAPGTEHSLRVSSTGSWSGGTEASFDIRFTTGSASTLTWEETPPLVVVDAWDEESEDSCAYSLARRATLETTPPPHVRAPLALFNIYEVLSDGSPDALVHTIRVHNPPPEPDTAVDDSGLTAERMKQYLDGTTPREDCYRLTMVDAAGGETLGSLACWDTGEPGDTAPTHTGDTAGPGDSDDDTARPHSDDSGPADTVPHHTGEHTADSDPGPPSSPSDGCPSGCGGSRTAAAFVWLLLATATTFRRDP